MQNAFLISEGQTPDRADRLKELEARITLARKGGIEIGRALKRICDEHLFDTYCDFETYARIRWRYQRAYAYRLIQAATLADSVLDQLKSTRVDIAEKLADWGNVHAALALEPVPVSKRVDVLIRAAELAVGIQPSHTHIRRAAAEVLGRVNVDRADERTERFDKAICKLEAMIRHVRDREKPIDRTAMASYLGDILHLVRERKTGRKHAKKKNR